MITKSGSDVAEIGVVIGRFQTPYLHEGHIEIIDHVVKTHPRVFIFLGQSPLKCTQTDPLDFNTRRAMLEETYPNIEVHRIDDIGDDYRWSRDLDKMIGLLAGPFQKVVLYGSRDSFLKAYKGHYPKEELQATHFVSATEIRKSIGICSKKSRAFREGAVWAMQNQWPKVYCTVDIAVLSEDFSHVLLGKKPSDTLWRFPGGFSDVISTSFESDAMRELVEETHLVANDIEYIGSTLIDDWRYRWQADKIKTMFFVVTRWKGPPIAGDDLEKVEWKLINKLHPDELVANHRILWSMLMIWLEKKSAQKN